MNQIKRLKDQARDRYRLEECVVELASVPFKVLSHGSGRFGYALQCDDFFIKASKPGSHLPALEVQIKSGAFLKRSSEENCKLADLIASELAPGAVAHVSRADLAHDFSTNYPMESLTRFNCICRAKEMTIHLYGAHFTGFTVGMGGDVALRVYDKTREAKKNNKPEWPETWAANGWDSKGKVWRAEYQVKRKELASFEIHSWVDLLCAQAKIWEHYSTKWFRVVEFTSDATHRNNSSRWQIASWWQSLAFVYGSYPDSGLVRVVKEKNPANDAYKYRNGIAALIGHMAQTGEKHLGAALRDFFYSAKEFHGGPEFFRSYVEKKLRVHIYNQSKVMNTKGLFIPNQCGIRDEDFPDIFDDLEAIPF